jgi:hypothetical protein
MLVMSGNGEGQSLYIHNGRNSSCFRSTRGELPMSERSTDDPTMLVLDREVYGSTPPTKIH